MKHYSTDVLHRDGEIVWDYIAPMLHPNRIFDGESNAMFRAYRHTVDSPEIANRHERLKRSLSICL